MAYLLMTPIFVAVYYSFWFPFYDFPYLQSKTLPEDRE